MCRPTVCVRKTTSTLNINQLIDYLSRQFELFYPDAMDVRTGLIKIMPDVVERLEHCFLHIHKKYYFEQGEAVFNHLNSDHYAMFLYILANTAYRQDFIQVAEKAFLLNKALHAIDAFYSITLPDIFLFVHPVGTVLGNANYADFLVVYQNVTVGSDLAGIYPDFGKANVLYSKSSVIGKCKIGDNVCIAANTFVRNMDVPDNSVVVGLYPANSVKTHNRDNTQDFFPLSD